MLHPDEVAEVAYQQSQQAMYERDTDPAYADRLLAASQVRAITALALAVSRLAAATEARN